MSSVWPMGSVRIQPYALLTVLPDVTIEQQLQPLNIRHLKFATPRARIFACTRTRDDVGAAKPLALTRHEGRTILVLTDPGGEPLDRILDREREQPLDLTRSLDTIVPLLVFPSSALIGGLLVFDMETGLLTEVDATNALRAG